MQMKRALFLTAVTALLVLSFPLAGFAADADVVGRAKDAVDIWQSQPQAKLPPMGCEHCSVMYDTIQTLDARGTPLAGELNLLLEKSGKGLSDIQLQRMQTVTENLEAVIMERKSHVYQYDKASAEYRMLKSRPDDKKAREERLYDNPMRAR